MKISAYAHVHNEEKMLELLLPNLLGWADQVCIVDEASTDDTGKLCKQLLRPNDVYFCHPSNTFYSLGSSFGVNLALSFCTNPWVFRFDGDDFIRAEDGLKLCELLDTTTADAFTFDIQTYCNFGQITLEEAFRAICATNGKAVACEFFSAHQRLARRAVGVIHVGWHDDLQIIPPYFKVEHSDILIHHLTCFKPWLDHVRRVRMLCYKAFVLRGNPHLHQHIAWRDEILSRYRKCVEVVARQVAEEQGLIL